MRKRLPFILTLLVVLMMVLAACGGGDDASEDSADPGQDTSEDVSEEAGEAADEAGDAVDEAADEADAAADEAVDEADEATDDAADEVEEETDDAADEGEEGAADEEMETVERPEGGLLIWADEQRAPIVRDLGGRFTEETGIPIAIQQLGFGDIRDQMKLAAPAGEGPDIIVGAHDWLGELVVNGLITTLDLGAVGGELTEPAVQAFTYDGEVYGLPTNTENVALFRNPDLVPDAPATWDDVLSTCAELGDQVEQCFAHIVGDPYHFYPIQTAYGGGVFGTTEDGSYDPTQVEIDSEGSIAAASALETMVQEGYVGTDVDWETAHVLFEDGNAAFIITGPWALERLNDSGVSYAISPIPSETEAGQPFLGAQGFMVSAFSEETALAQSFLIDYVATPEVMAQISDETGRPSAMQSVLDEQTAASEDLAGFAEAGAEARPMPAIPEMASVWSSWEDALKLIVNGEEEAAPAFQNAAEQIRTAIDSGS